MRSVIQASAPECKIEKLRSLINLPIYAAVEVSGGGRLGIELDGLATGTAADECAKPYVRGKYAVDTNRRAVGGIGGLQHRPKGILVALPAKAAGPYSGVIEGNRRLGLAQYRPRI